MAPSDPKTAIRAKAAELGFDAVGFARADLPWGAGARLVRAVAHVDDIELSGGRKPGAVLPVLGEASEEES